MNILQLYQPTRRHFFNMAATKMRLQAALVFLCCLATVASQNPACTPQVPGPNDPAMPSFPSFYDAHIEANILNRNYTADFHLWVDKDGNRIAIHIDNAGVRSQDIYNFATDEIFAIDRVAGTCMVEAISTVRTTDPFRTSLNLFDPTSTPSLTSIMNYGSGSAVKYINQTAVRGIQTNLWRSCVVIPSSKSTMTVDYYYSTATWLTPGFNQQMPVRFHVYGNTRLPNGQNRQFDHIYEFATFNVVPNHLTVFETPDGVVCPKRKNTKPLPTPSTAFRFSAETLTFQPSQDFNIIAHVREQYDFDNNIVKFDMSASPDSTNPTTRVHDFNTGLAYIVDDVTGGCVVNTIDTSAFDVRTVDSAQHVRIRTAQEFFYFDKAQYVYEGTKNVRDILTDVWIGSRALDDSPNVNVTWEWYFATADYQKNLPEPLQFGLPVKMSMTDTMGRKFVYNIYDYDEGQPAVWSYDISQCYNYTEKRDFTFQLPGNFQTVVGSNIELFKYATIKAISKACFVNNIMLSPLRINNLQVDYQSSSTILVSFAILDKAPAVGNVVAPKPENDLSTVATQLSRQINGGLVRIRMRDSNQQIQDMTATPFTLTNTQHVIKNAYYTIQQQGSVSSSGASGGAMAGMGVALLVVAFILGVLGTYFFYRRQGGAFVAKKFDNTDITQDS